MRQSILDERRGEDEGRDADDDADEGRTTEEEVRSSSSIRCSITNSLWRWNPCDLIE
jgi:hypothetical protein